MTQENDRLMNASLDNYLDMLNELDALLTSDPMPDSPEGLRAQVLIDTLSALDQS